MPILKFGNNKKNEYNKKNIIDYNKFTSFYFGNIMGFNDSLPITSSFTFFIFSNNNTGNQER